MKLTSFYKVEAYIHGDGDLLEHTLLHKPDKIKVFRAAYDRDAYMRALPLVEVLVGASWVFVTSYINVPTDCLPDEESK